jgi:MYXO-CTERM domain-containing protein
MRRGLIHTALPILGLALLVPRASTAACPDGTWQAEDGEACDDGNTSLGDGCNADCQVECSEVRGAATEVACGRGEFGPFTTEPAQLYPGFIFTDISAPNTYFTLTLGGETGVDHHGVIFYPTMSGDFAIYMKTNFPLTLRDSATGEAVPVFLEHAISSCSVADSLTWVKTFKDLSDQVQYILDIGPIVEATVSVSIEYLPSFDRLWHRDTDHDTFGGDLIGQSWCTAPAAYLPDGGDCDDTNADAHPEATESCNGLDDDCDSTPDVETPGLCDATATGSICLDTGSLVTCGCQTDADCSESLECNPATYQCEEPSTGEGGTGAGGDAGAGAAGDSGGSGEEPTAGAAGEPSGGAGGTGSTGGTSGTAGKMTSGGSSKGGTATTAGSGGKTSLSPDEDEGDSGCQVGGAPSGSGWLWLAGAIATLLRRRQRYPHSAP